MSASKMAVPACGLRGWRVLRSGMPVAGSFQRTRSGKRATNHDAVTLHCEQRYTASLPSAALRAVDERGSSCACDGHAIFCA
jgi:hypothetical protein